MPNLGTLVRDKGQMTVTDRFLSTKAADIIKKMSNSSAKNQTAVVMAYYKKSALSASDKDKIRDKVHKLNQEKSKYDIISISDPLTNSALAGELISKDKTTLLVSVSVNPDKTPVSKIRSNLTGALKIDGLSLYSTGSALVSEDFVETTEAGIEKTEIITAIFILLVLLIIFRSVITPLVTLLTVIISFIVSLNFVGQLVSYFDFPISSFTEIFLVLILFGIGTDYTMLLMMRFKEELEITGDKYIAVLNTYKTAGKTVVFSSLTIFIGFSCLYFAEFFIFKSAAAVAVGILVLDIVLLTFIPALMVALGKHMFWSPFKSSGHKESKAWKFSASFSAKFPYVSILVVAVVCCLIFFYNKSLSFDSLKEVDPSYPSIIGNNVVAAHFSAGDTMPVTVAIENRNPMDNQKDLAQMDKLTDALKSIKGVNKVYSVTQPQGKKEDLLYLGSQAGTLKSGVDQCRSGVDTVGSGLQSAVSQLSAANTGTSAAQQLVTGSNQLTNSLFSISAACDQLKSGIGTSAQYSQQILAGISELDTQLGVLDSGLKAIASNYGQLKTQCSQLGQQIKPLVQEINYFTTSTDLTDPSKPNEAQLKQLLSLASAYSDSKNAGKYFSDPTAFACYAGMYNLLSNEYALLNQNGKTISDNANRLLSVLDTVNDPNGYFSSFDKFLAQAEDGISALKGGADTLQTAMQKMSSGLSMASGYQSQLANAMAAAASGSQQLNNGQSQLVAALGQISDMSKKLGDGLSGAGSGLNSVSGGLQSVGSFLNGINGSDYASSNLYVPQDSIEKAPFVESLNSYMSKDRKITDITITLKVDPYSQKAMDIVNNISGTVRSNLQNSSLKSAQFGIAGISQSNVDLSTISQGDFARSSLIMLVGIFIVLIIVTQDFWMPLFVIASLVASYYLAVSLSCFIFNNLLKFGALSYNVPFCSFIMIVTLGVDYSIFLISRHKENKGMQLTNSITMAAAKVGGVITSAGLILSGTFAAMYPSNVRTLMELSVTVIIGIILLCTVFLPIFIPTVMSIKAKLTKT